MARRRKKRSDIFFRLFIVISLVVSFLISIIVSNITGKFNVTIFLILFFSILVGLSILAIILSLPSVKGKIGERKVRKKLERLANKYDGKLINDVIVPGENDKTSQIDHILISPYGVYVIETKNYAGRIYGSENQKEWTQVLAFGNTKNKLYNPFKQNDTHIFRLKRILSMNIELVNVVVFVNNNTKYINSDSVWGLSDLKHLIDPNEDQRIISDKDVESIYNIIMEYKNNPVVTSKEHKKEVKQMVKDINNNICPRCGGNLVLRKGSNGSFYGCSNYPKCKFTKKA